MSDMLRMDHINSLPQPFMVRLYGGYEWPMYDVCVQTGLMRIDVCGLLERKDFADVAEITDADGVKHNPESWYLDYKD